MEQDLATLQIISETLKELPNLPTEEKVCLAGKLNDDVVQKLLINAGCFSFVNMIQDIK